MTAVVVGKVLLLAFLIVACSVVAIIYVRRRRAGVQPWKSPTASPYLDVYRGGTPPIPPPPQTLDERSADGGGRDLRPDCMSNEIGYSGPYRGSLPVKRLTPCGTADLNRR